MPNENGTVQQQPQTSTEETRKRQPEYIAQYVTQDGDKERWTKIGVGWENERGYITPKYDIPPPDPEKVVFQPRAELERLREERKQREALSQNADVSQKL